MWPWTNLSHLIYVRVLPQVLIQNDSKNLNYISWYFSSFPYFILVFLHSLTRREWSVISHLSPQQVLTSGSHIHCQLLYWLFVSMPCVYLLVYIYIYIYFCFYLYLFYSFISVSGEICFWPENLKTASNYLCLSKPKRTECDFFPRLPAVVISNDRNA